MKREDFIEEVEQVLLGADMFTDEADPEFADWFNSYLISGGKRVRPSLVWMVAGDREMPDWEPYVLLGAAIEMTHNWTLVLDDWMDRDEQRRGEPSLHRRIADESQGFEQINEAEFYGQVQSTLVGTLMELAADSLIPRLSKFLGEEGFMKLSSGYTKAVGRVIEGQLLDFRLQDDLLQGREIDSEEAERVMRLKTASLFELAVAGSALIAGEDPRKFKNWGKKLGLSYQLRNDLSDLDTEQRKPGSDLRELKPTVLNVLLMAQLSDAEKQRWRQVRSGDEDVDWLIEKAYDLGVVEQLSDRLKEQLGDLERDAQNLFSEPGNIWIKTIFDRLRL